MLPFALKTVGTKFPSFSQKGTKGKGIPPSQPRHHPGTTQDAQKFRKITRMTIYEFTRKQQPNVGKYTNRPMDPVGIYV